MSVTRCMFVALFITACANQQEAGSRLPVDGAIGEPGTSPWDAADDANQTEAGRLCPAQADACPSECISVIGFRFNVTRVCIGPLQVISCTALEAGSTQLESCVIRRVDGAVFKTNAIYRGLDLSVWRQCEPTDEEYAAVARAKDCEDLSDASIEME